MELERENKRLKTLIIVLLILLVGATAYIYYTNFIKSNNDTNKDNEQNIELDTTEIDIQEYVKLDSSKNNSKKFSIDLKSAYEANNLIEKISNIEDYNISLIYKIDDYKIRLKLKNSTYSSATEFGVYVNNKYIYDDYAFLSSNINVETLDKYLIFKNNGGTDIRSIRLYIVDETGLLLDLYELEDTPGMVAKDYIIDDDKIEISGTRMTHNSTFMYNDKRYELLTKDNCQEAINEFGNDFVIEATYTYEYTNDTLNLESIVSNKITLNEFLSKNSNDEFYCK